ncbi:MAG: LysR family transcriptional regulator [Pseudomonadota bacterium]
MTTLDIDAVKAFVAVADHQSFTRAAEALGTTQGAVSVKLKRLEDRVGRRLIERTPRLVRLSAQGAEFLVPARDFLAAHERAVAGLGAVRRQLTLGIAVQVGGPELPALLARLSRHDPELAIEVRLDDARQLLESLDRGELDAAVVRREDGRRTADVLATEHFGWYATPDFVYRSGEPLRLAASAPACGIQEGATRALDAAGIRWTQAFLGCGTFVVADAVRAGLATAVFSRRLAPAGTVEVSGKFGLPVLPPSDIVLLSGLSDSRSRKAFQEVAAAFREHRP